MTWYNVVGLISVTTLFLPIIVILAFRLAWYKSFPALLVYYIIVFGYNVLTLDLVNLDNRFTHYFGIFNNLLDAPLMLCFMTYFSKTALFRKRMLLVVIFFMLFEIMIVALYGLTVRATVIVMGPGLLMILILSLLFFFHQAKITIIHQKAAGKAFIVTSLLFAYGGYSFIYIVYYVMHSPYRTDTYIVYYLITIFSSLLLTTGVYLERKRVRQLSEVQTTRKELKIIYGGSN